MYVTAESCNIMEVFCKPLDLVYHMFSHMYICSLSYVQSNEKMVNKITE